MQLIPEAGHFPTLEAPEATTAAIEAFLAGPVLLR
jgi:pimeloyl-ACP methyl ester carboxylesterase